MKTTIYFDKPKPRRRIAAAASVLLVATVLVTTHFWPEPKKLAKPEPVQPANSPWKLSPFG